MRQISTSVLIICSCVLVRSCPLGCKCIREKNLASCTSAEFDSVPKGFPTYITEISLADNKIQSLVVKSFPRQLALMKLDIAENQISDINSDAFVATSQKYGNRGEMVESLLILSIRSNKLSFIPSDALKNLQSLEELDLARNKILIIESNAFSSLSNLQQLDLSNNVIEMAAVDAFQGLQNLKVLDLSLNSLSLISPSTFGHLTSLNQLYVTRNSLRKIHQLAFSHFTSLKELHLAANRIDAIPDKLFSSIKNSLLILDVSKNELKELNPVAFQGLEHLQSLNLCNNHLTKLHDEKSKSFIFEQLSSLKILKVDSNLINSVLDSSLNSLQQLQQFTLSGNLIKTFPKISLPSLEKLDISSNLLVSMDKTSLQDLPCLERLDLADNLLSDVTSDAFSFCHRLRSLHLERNRLTIPHTSWFATRRFGRRRSHINACVGHLAENPWLCDCRTWAFAHAIAKSRSTKSEDVKIYVNSDVMMCDQPEKFFGKTFTEFANADLGCDVTIQLTRHQWKWIFSGFIALAVVYVCVARLNKGLRQIHKQRGFTKPTSKHL